MGDFIRIGGLKIGGCENAARDGEIVSPTEGSRNDLMESSERIGPFLAGIGKGFRGFGCYQAWLR